MTETFGMRFTARRLATIVPATEEKPEHVMTQEELAEILEVSLSAVRCYSRDRRLPHPIIRRAILRLWPDFFSVPLQV